jgi:hypothetical protein
LLGTPSVQSIHDYYPFAMVDGGRLAPMAAELVDRLAILVAVRRFLGMGVVDSRSLRSDNSVRMQHFVCRSTLLCPFSVFLGDVRREFMQRRFVALHGTMGSYLRDAFQEGMPSCSSGLGLFLFSSFCLVASTAFSCKTFLDINMISSALQYAHVANP